MAVSSTTKLLKKGLRDQALTYSEVQDIIRSVASDGWITKKELAELQSIYKKHGNVMNPRAKKSLGLLLARLLGPGKGRTNTDGNRIPFIIKGPGEFSRRNTDLGKFSHGNFDVQYQSKTGQVWVTLRVKYEFEEGISKADRSSFKYRLKWAVAAWDNADVYLKSDDLTVHPIIDLRFVLKESSSYHFLVDVEKEDRREWVGSDLNVDINTSLRTLIHELGHVYGNYDEYRGTGTMGWVERRMWWHDNKHLRDKSALMNSGTEFRARYFGHFERWVNMQFRRYGVTYQAVRMIV